MNRVLGSVLALLFTLGPLGCEVLIGPPHGRVVITPVPPPPFPAAILLAVAGAGIPAPRSASQPHHLS